MSFDLAVTASVQLIAKETSAGQAPGPSVGPFPFGFTQISVDQPWTQVTQVLPGDTFGGAEKVVDIPPFLRGAPGSGKQTFLLIKTDLPVKVQVRDVAVSPVTFERTLQSGGSVMIAGGDPDVDRVAYEGIAQSQPFAHVSLWLISR